MKSKSLRIPIIIITIGLLLSVLAHVCTSIQKKPTVTEQDFAYSVTYKLDGETKTFHGIYTSRFSGFGNDGIDPLDRYYVEEYVVDGTPIESRTYTIAEKDGVELYIVTPFNDCYLMGDTDNDSYSLLEDPYLEAVAEEGYSYDYNEDTLLAMFDAEIVSFEYPEPIDNTFVFAGISGLHSTGVLAMVAVGMLALILCLIVVKKGEGVVYGALDVVGIVLNFAAVFVALPILSLAAFLIQACPTGPDWIYQAYLLIPPIIPFTLAASVSLRRKGFRKSGFCIQFLGIVILVILAVLEYVL